MTLVAFLLALAIVVRGTRLIGEDKITDPLRQKLLVSPLLEAERKHYEENPWGTDGHTSFKRSGFRHFVNELISCPWCLSVWLGAAVAPVAYHYGDNQAFILVGAAAALSHLTGLAHQLSEYLDARSSY